jgi:hypothetical protein
MAEQTQHGSCHCGAVRYTVDIDLAKGTVRCNCTLCRKTRAWLAFAPAENFRLDTGEGQTTKYRWTPEGKEQPNLTYHSCSTCGVRTHAEGTAPGGARTVAIQVATINGLDRNLLVPGIRYVDGLHDDFKNPPVEDVRGL